MNKVKDLWRCSMIKIYAAYSLSTAIGANVRLQQGVQGERHTYGLFYWCGHTPGLSLHSRLPMHLDVLYYI